MLRKLREAYHILMSNDGEYKIDYWYCFDDCEAYLEVETFTLKSLKDKIKEIYLIFKKK